MVVLLCAMMSVIGLARADEPPFTLDLVNNLDQPVYRLGGYINFGSAKIFSLKMKIDETAGGWVILDSVGGSTEDAITIGREVRRLGLKTIVPNGAQCLSSCAVIWAGGVERWSERGSVIAFHRPWMLRSKKDADQTHIRTYYRDMGYSPAAIEKFLAPAKSFYVLDARKAQKLKIDVHFTE